MPTQPATISLRAGIRRGGLRIRRGVCSSESSSRNSVRFPDLPEALTQGETLEQAIAMAADALVTAPDFYLEDGRPVPSRAGAQP